MGRPLRVAATADGMALDSDGSGSQSGINAWEDTKSIQMEGIITMTVKRIATIVAAVFVVALLASPAMSQDTGKKDGQKAGKQGRGGQMDAQGFIDRYDTDKDGKISKEEWKAAGTTRFDEADKNKDGFIDNTEVMGLMSRGRSKGGETATPPAPTDLGPLAAADTNKDGKISKEEFLKFREDQLTKADANKDGSIDKDEVMGLFSSMRPDAGKGGDTAKGGDAGKAGAKGGKKGKKGGAGGGEGAGAGEGGGE